MPATLSYPGVYIEEISSGVHTITGVATSITAFIGRALRGPIDEDAESPIIVNSFADFERVFGGLSPNYSLGFAVRDFFLNGGAQAAIVRIVKIKKADGTDVGNKDKLFAHLTMDSWTFIAPNPGKWGSGLRVAVDLDISADTAKALGFTKTVDGKEVGDPSKLFNLTIRDVGSGIQERILNATFASQTTSKKLTNNRVDKLLARSSKLLRWEGAVPPPAASPKVTAARAAYDVLATKNADLVKALAASPQVPADILKARTDVVAAQKDLSDKTKLIKDNLSLLEDALADKKSAGVINDIRDAEFALAQAIAKAADDVEDDGDLEEFCFTGSGTQAGKRGLYALEKADLFNILCIPPYKPTSFGVSEVDLGVIAEAARYCEEKRAFYVIDPPASWDGKAAAVDGIKDFITNSKNAGIFFPRLRQPNPFHDNDVETFAPCGAIAGIFARTDTERGVWKAPAGLEASVVAVPELSVNLSDAENGELNPKAVNCLRAFPAAGRVVWGSRTLQGADGLASEWKYIPVRRTALFIEESLYRGTQWVVFEPNDEPLWAQIRLNVGAFMQDLFRKGAFQGKTPREAYLVKCDNETTTQNDINLGIVNIIVGFAPLKPAEFVIIKLQQLAGQIEV